MKKHTLNLPKPSKSSFPKKESNFWYAVIMFLPIALFVFGLLIANH